MIASRTRADTRTLTVLTRVAPGRVDELREILRDLGSPAASPFAAVPGVHFARLVVVDSLVHQERPTALGPLARLVDRLTHGPRGEQRPDPLPDPYLLFTATMDVLSPDQEAGYFHALRAMGPRADAIWGLCVGYPGHHDAEAFARFLRDHSLPADYVFTGAVSGTVDRIRDALRLRDQLGEFAASTQDADDNDLHQRFRNLFRKPAGRSRTAMTRPTATRPTATRSTATRSTATHPGAAAAYPADATIHPGTATVEPGTAAGAAGPSGAVIEAPAPDDLDRPDIQGVVLDRYPNLLASTHLFVRITEPAAARRWLAAAADRVTTVHFGPARADRALNIGLSHAGLAALGVPAGDLATFPAEFRQGMYRREGLLAPQHGTAPWEQPFTGADAVHAVVLLAGRDRAEVDAWTTEVRRELADGFQILAEQAGDRISAEPVHGVRRFMEHFGFVDGLSRPGVAGHDDGTSGDVLPPGEFVLGYRDVDGDVSGAGLPDRLARNGSFLVYRKLEQDVPAFRRLTNGLAHRFGDARTVAAKLIGRWPDGTPLTQSPEAPRPDLAGNSGFGYADDMDGARCPLGAHVRRANPRDALPIGSRLTRRHHMLRRGVPYGPYLTGADDRPAAGGRGLLFLAVVGDLGRQFEFVQTEWMNDGNAFGLGREQDALTCAGGATARMTVQGAPPTFVPITQSLVTCRGGEYFLLPGISALKALADPPPARVTRP